jgi:ABC-2 type transport system ATP-binding protein
VTVRSDAQPAIRVQGLQKSYEQLQVLRGVDLDVDPRSILALLGSNGAGKTTVVRILSTLLKADAGTALINGFDVATQAAQVRESFSLTGQFAAVDEILSGGRTSSWSPSCATSTTRARPRTTCSLASR